jgi:hypothetical protein
MPHDPIQRWEWEGGAVAVDASAGEDERRDQAGGRTAHPAGPRSAPRSSGSPAAPGEPSGNRANVEGEV